MKKIILGSALLLLLFMMPFASKAAIVIAETHTNVTCNGASSGAIDITPSGGTLSYTYAWSDGDTTQDRTGLSAGSYSVTVTDFLGVTGSLLINISQPATAMSIVKSITTVYCGGGNTGAIDLTVSGGAGGYSYAWSDFVYTEDRVNLTAANYYITVTDAAGCIRVDSANVTQPPGMVINKAITNVTCGSGANGAINLTVSFGIPGYTFLWNDGNTNEDRTGIASGPYSVTVTDASGCTTSATATVGQSGGGMAINTTSTQPSCNGGSNGTITVTSVIGSVGPYTFHWSDGPTSQNRTGISAGSYTVTATSTTGCTASATVNVGQPAVLNVTLTPIILTCFSSNNGAINTAPSGGTAPYTYNWGGGVFTQNRTGLVTGNYTVTVTDFRGCTVSQTTFVPEPLQLTVTTIPAAQACIGGPTGSVTTTVNGGTGTYSYWWGSGITTPNRINVNAGTYSVTVTDGNGCTASASGTVLGYTPMVLTTGTTQVNNTCYGASVGSINLNVTNGWPGYSYIWSNGDTTQDISGLTAGNYTVTVDDSHLCSATSTITITQPSFPITINSTVTDVNCNSGSNGAISLSVVNGSIPYSYNWGGGIVTQNRTSLVAGNYPVTVTDNSGCTVSASITVNQPTPIVVSETITNSTCNGGNNGSITLAVSGGFAPYSYNWGGGVTTQNRTGLAQGSYSVTISDNHSCSTSPTFTVTQPTPITVSPSISNVTCNGGSNGAINISVSGGAGSYTYNWGGGIVSQNRSGLAAGNYNLTVTDNATCTVSSTIAITQPSAILLSPVIANVSCNGGNNGGIQLVVSGGSTPYTFNWGGGIVSQHRTSLSAGNYAVTVTDNATCTATYSTSITQPAPLNISSTTTAVSCNGGANGTINTTVTGGSIPYTYNWGGGVVTPNRTNLSQGTYTVTVTDNAACTAIGTAIVNQPAAILTSTAITNATCNGFANGAINLTVSGGAGAYSYIWSNGAVTEDITGVAANSYTVTVTDAGNCTVQTNATVSEASAILLTTAQTNVSCNGGSNGSIDLTATGGTGVYTYNWSNGRVTQDISGLAAQSYSVTVSDNNTCSSTAVVAITHPAVFTIGETHTNINCNGVNNGSITVTASGGTMPYTYVWSDAINTPNRTALAAGNYTVTASDLNGCTATLSAGITQPAAIVVSTTKTNVTCAGTATGAIDLTVSGGTGSYLYQWSNNILTQDLASIAAGTYSVTVTDGNTCTALASATITQPTPITISFSLGNVTCYGGSNGSINTVTSGGNGGYIYNWSNGAHTPAISGLTAGSYSLSLNDASNCATTLSFNVTQPAQILLTETHTGVSCNNANSGSINLTATGGALPYTYVWSNNITTQDQNALGAGSYSVVVTDQSNCTAALGPVIIAQPNAMSLSTVASDVVCNGSGTGSIDLTVNGGNGAITYHWSNGATTQDISGVSAGTYLVTVTDASTCLSTTSAVINQSSGIAVNLTKADATCFGSANGSVTTAINGGNNGYTYIWSTGATSQNISNLVAGTYAVTVRDAQNCSVSSSVAVGQPSQIAINATRVNVDCNGNASGRIQTAVSGGAGGYTFLWSNTATSASLNNLAANTYSLTVTDATSCSSSIAVNIAQPAILSLSETHRPYACASKQGAIDLEVQGGTAPYNYTWSGGATTQDRSNLTAGNYSVNVADANGCASSLSVSITQLPILTTHITKTDVTCNGGNNGSINLVVAGGTAPYQYSWNNGATSPSLNGLAATNYRVLVTDSNSCNIVDTTTILQPVAINLSATTHDVSCFGSSNGSVNVIASGGLGGHHYQWSNGATTANISNLAGGSYSLTVTDGNSCSASQAYAVNQPQQLNIAATVTPVACAGRADGQVQLSVTGGAAPFAYNWNNTTGTTHITNLAEGSYDVTVTDNSGCTISGGYIIGSMPAMTITPVVNNTACAEVQNGSIDLTVTGGTATYSFDWNTGRATEDINNLAQGNYTVTVTDARNCTVQGAYTISYEYALTVDATQSTIINLGEAIQLNAVANVNHGNVYSWTPANTISCGNCASTEATPTSNTSYTVNVVDANGCRAFDTLTITVNSITDIFIPNAFSPNNDGNNDVFELYGDKSSIAFLDIKIFDRWGEMVFESNNHNFTWDGTYKGETVQQGVFIYTAKIAFLNGYVRNDMKGSLTVIR